MRCSERPLRRPCERTGQLFYNSAGDHADKCFEALKAIGKKSHSLLTQACDLFPERRPSVNRDVRQKQLSDPVAARHIDDLIQGEIEVDLLIILVGGLVAINLGPLVFGLFTVATCTYLVGTFLDWLGFQPPDRRAHGRDHQRV